MKRMEMQNYIGNIALAAKQLEHLKEIHGNNLYFTCNGRLVDDFHAFGETCSIRGHIRVLGGKGGFGSMLRALGARIEKTTNHEACRDLNGRRMRDVNNEKNIAEWMKNQDDKEEERQRKRQEKLEKVLNPKHHYEDQNYTTSLQQNADKIDEALSYARLNQKEEISRKRRDNGDISDRKSKKSKMWLGIDDDEDLSDEDPNEEEDNIKENSSGNVQEGDEQSESCGKDEGAAETGDKFVTDGANTEEVSQHRELVPLDSEKRNSVTKADSSKVNGMDKVTIGTNEMPSTLKCCKQSSNGIKPIPLDLSLYSSAEQLEEVGLDVLKSTLVFHGLKCGGTLQERAKRLFLLKTTPIEKLDANLFAKAAKKNKNK